MKQPQTFSKFQYLYVILKHAKVIRYAEYDNTKHCYYELLNCISIPIQQQHDKISISLRDAKTGELLHSIHEEKDFSHGTIEYNTPYTKITLFFKSDYCYIFHVYEM